MIYLDHSATSFPKPKGVIEEMETCMRDYCGNPGRSGHRLSIMMGEKIYETRKALGKLMGIQDPSRLLFTKNTTESLNLALKGFLREGDHVITTSMEHNSMLRPLKALEKQGVRHTIVRGTKDGYVMTDSIQNALEDETRLIAVTGASNITGTLLPLKEISVLAKKEKIPLLVDGAQLVGKFPMNMDELQIDLLAFPGHKGLHGPPGTGALYVSPSVDLVPQLYGGTGTLSRSRIQPLDFPEGFEAGTANGPGIVGLGYAAKWLHKVGIDTIACYEKELLTCLEEMLRNMEGVTCYGPAPGEKTGVCLFNIGTLNSEEVTERLSREYNIAVRGGFHCAGLAHDTIGTGKSGAVRLSVGPYNTKREMIKAAEAIWRLNKVSLRR